MPKLFLGECEYKWSHVDTKMENLWIEREIGTPIYKEIQENNFDLKIQREEGFVPDLYCKSKIYLELDNSDRALLFLLKWSKDNTLNIQPRTRINLYEPE